MRQHDDEWQCSNYSRINRRRQIAAIKRRRIERVLLLISILVIVIAVPLWLYKPKPAEITKIRHPQEVAVLGERVQPAKYGAVQQGTQSNKNGHVEDQRNIRSSGKSAITFLGVGDILFDRQVASIIKKHGVKELFSDVKEILQTGDLVAGNMECPLSARGEPVEGKEFTFRGAPEAAKGMKDAGINMVSLANNHIMDYGKDAMQDTIETLDGVDIAHAGVGNTEKEAYEPVVINIKGNKVAFFASTAVLPEGFWVTSGRPGVAGTRLKWDYIVELVKRASKKNDYVIVSLHWGTEYEDYPEEYQRRLARDIIDAGADIILGHHPHVIQGIEVYNKKLIAYSTGDFVFDHYRVKTGEAFILRVLLDKDSISKVQIIPTYADFSGKPDIVEGEKANSILKRLNEISTPFKTQIEILGDIAEVKL